MYYIIAIILLVLTAYVIFLALKNHVCNKAEIMLSLFNTLYKKYESILKADYDNLSIKIHDLFPDYFNESIEAKTSADLRKFFIIVGYYTDRYSASLNESLMIDSEMYFDFSNYFRELKLTSFKKGEPFRKKDLKGKKKTKRDD